MTYVIANACIDVMDQSCIEVCPVDCIYFETEDRMCYIEPNDCTDCGACEPACPVGAIFKDDEVPNDAQQFIRINELWFEDKDSARGEIETIVRENPSIL
jgi:ferredoxin